MTIDISRLPQCTLPTGLLLTVVILLPAAVGGAWFAIAWFGESQGAAVAACLGCLIVALTAVAGMLVMVPWKERDMAMWMTLWLAATVVRLLLTPLLAYLLYSAVSLSPRPYTLAIATSYFVTLMGEVIVLTRTVGRDSTSGDTAASRR